METYSGTFANVIAILVGGGLGVLIGSRIEERYRKLALQCLGIFTICIGVKMAIQMESVLIVVSSLLLGAMTGEFLRIEDRLESFGVWLKSKASGFKGEQKKFAEAFVTTTIVFCVGSIAIVGSIDSGIRGDHTLLYMKSLLDGVFTLTISSTMGVGAVFSFIPVMIYQGLLTFGATFVADWMSDEVTTAISATGGLMIVGLALNMLQLSKIRIGNLLPGLFFAFLFSMFFG